MLLPEVDHLGGEYIELSLIFFEIFRKKQDFPVIFHPDIFNISGSCYLYAEKIFQSGKSLGVQGVQNVPRSAWVKTDVASKTANATSVEPRNGDALVCCYGDETPVPRRVFDAFYICRHSNLLSRRHCVPQKRRVVRFSGSVGFYSHLHSVPLYLPPQVPISGSFPDSSQLENSYTNPMQEKTTIFTEIFELVLHQVSISVQNSAHVLTVVALWRLRAPFAPYCTLSLQSACPVAAHRTYRECRLLHYLKSAPFV
jgi:hypothetical protein